MAGNTRSSLPQPVRGQASCPFDAAVRTNILILASRATTGDGGKVPPQFSVVGRLIRIDRLAVGDLSLFTGGFRIRDQREEEWTARFNLFKSDDSAAVKAAIRTFCAAFDHKTWVTPWVGNARMVGVPVISSGDTRISLQSPVARLSKALASSRGWEWNPGLLRKTPHPRLSGMSSAEDRDSTVRGVYSSARIKGEPGVILVVDDFCTRGATFSDIARAVQESNPDWEVRAASLAKSENAHYWGGDLTNAHVPGVLDSAWRGDGGP